MTAAALDAVTVAGADDLAALTARLRAGAGVEGKRDIALTCGALGLTAASDGAPGDDCAALPDGHGGWLLYAMEGFIPAFVQADPWFAGWCGVMVNLSDVLAMGGRPIAVTNAIWAADPETAAPVLAGMRAAAEAYALPIVGGHASLRAAHLGLAVSMLGAARRLITSFDACPGDRLVVAVDHRGAYRAPFDNWQAALDAPHARLRGDSALLPALAEDGLVRAGKDISQAGLVGTALMLAESSGVGMRLDLDAIPTPPGVALERWLRSFPSFGFILSVDPAHEAAVLARFAERDIIAAGVGVVTAGTRVDLCAGDARATFWDHGATPYLNLGKAADA